VGTASVVNPAEPERPPSVFDPIGRMEMADLKGVTRVAEPDAPRLSEIFWALGVGGRQGMHIVVLPAADMPDHVVCLALCGTKAVPTRLAGGFTRLCDECRAGLRVIHGQVWQKLADEA
jgi:hypothetical protein